MSDEEYEYEEEEEVEEEVEEHYSSSKRSTHVSETADNENLTEAEKAMLAAKKRQQEEDNAKLMDYEERRRIEREREEEELRLLKEKQEQRRLQREEEERQLAEKKRQDEERRLREEEERRQRMEAEKKKKEEEKLKRAQMMSGFAGVAGTGRNFVVPEKKDKADKFGNIVQAKQEMGMTKEQQEEAKQNFLSSVRRAIDLDNVLSGDLKAKIKEMHARICKLEADKYDLEKRHERQTYDLKELNERQRQVARNRNSKQGAQDDTGGRHPPKIAVVNKYDRQIDRRNFKERRAMFDKKDAFPCFPNVPPPPTLLEFKPKKEIKYDVYQNEEVEEDAEEEYEEGEEEEEEEE